ncbi:MAG: hypothetical protein HZB87_07765 [Desulfatitalea sp.]|nr:hypothetical protein [Desulfatitalea sp.]
MLSITIPLWLLLSAAGLPALILIGLCLRLMRMRHNKEALAAVAPAPEAAPAAFDDRIHRQLLEQQIDAVFDVLTTLIETERCKLKALVNHAMPLTEALASAPATPAHVPRTVEALRIDAPAAEMADVPIARNIANLAEEGLAAAEIAKHLGLSLSEVTLALKMKAGRNPHLGRKVMAVA